MGIVIQGAKLNPHSPVVVTSKIPVINITTETIYKTLLSN